MRELDRDMGSKFASHGINTSLKQKENNHENVDKILTNLDSPSLSHEIEDSFGFWIPRYGFRNPGTGFQIFR